MTEDVLKKHEFLIECDLGYIMVCKYCGLAQTPLVIKRGCSNKNQRIEDFISYEKFKKSINEFKWAAQGGRSSY